MNQIPNIEETHNTKEQEIFWSDEIWACKYGEQAVVDLESKIHHQLQKVREDAQAEYKQFVLNVLDGIDIADGQCTTKAIRFALQSRIIPSELDQASITNVSASSNTGGGTSNSVTTRDMGPVILTHSELNHPTN